MSNPVHPGTPHSGDTVTPSCTVPVSLDTQLRVRTTQTLWYTLPKVQVHPNAQVQAWSHATAQRPRYTLNPSRVHPDSKYSMVTF